jgi:hypothetical protein
MMPSAVPEVLGGWMRPFRCHFTAAVWRHVLVLVCGSLLAPGRRTVAAALRVMGLGEAAGFAVHHRVLSHGHWCSRALAHRLLLQLVAAFVPDGPVVVGLDDTIERRWGARIAARGIYRDPVRSSRGHFVKASGLRWLCVMLLAPVPWAGCAWGLPFLAVLAPSERHAAGRGLRRKKLTDWGRQLVLQARRWMPGRQLVLVADSGFAALELLAALVRRGMTCVTRLRLDAALYEPAPPRRPGAIGRPRTKGRRLPTLAEVLADRATRWRRVAVPGWYGEGERVVEIHSGTAVWRHAGMPVVSIRWVLLRDPHGRFDPQALLCTDQERTPLQIVGWFVQRWPLEVTFREVRDHLGVETQRQWSDKAVARTTPCLLGLFSIVTLLAARLDHRTRLRVSAAAWYRKKHPTFSDALAAVRREIWSEQGLLTSRHSPEPAIIQPALRESIVHALCHAA